MIQELAVKQYKLWLSNPHHPSARFKKIGVRWSARITDDYRAIGVMEGDTVIWFFVGTHAEYNQVLKEKEQQSGFELNWDAKGASSPQRNATRVDSYSQLC